MFRFSSYAVVGRGEALAGRLTCRTCGHTERVRFDPRQVGSTQRVRCPECATTGLVIVDSDAFEPLRVAEKADWTEAIPGLSPLHGATRDDGPEEIAIESPAPVAVRTR